MTRQPPQFSTADTPTIYIQGERSGFTIGFLLFWLTGWLIGGAFAIRALALGLPIGPASLGPASHFLLKWLAGWLLGLLAMGYLLIWQLAGKEIITITATTLLIRQQAGPLGGTEVYSLERLRHLRAQPDAWPSSLTKSQRSDWDDGSVLFDYGAKTIRFGRLLSEAEAQRIVAFLQQHRVGVRWAFGD